MYQHNDETSVIDEGWIAIKVSELDTLRNEFISFYNKNGGIPLIKEFKDYTTNCCFALDTYDTYLTIDGSYLYPATTIASEQPNQCTLSYELDIYGFYQPLGANFLNKLPNDAAFGTTNVCSESNNPGIYVRFC